MSRIDNLTQEPDFSKRADAFVLAVNTLVKQQHASNSDIQIDAENHTKDSMQGPDRLLIKELQQDLEKKGILVNLQGSYDRWGDIADKMSAHSNFVTVDIIDHQDRVDLVNSIISVVTEQATTFGGKLLTTPDEISESIAAVNSTEDRYRYGLWVHLMYDFTSPS